MNDICGLLFFRNGVWPKEGEEKAVAEENSTFPFMVAGEQVARKWQRESTAITPASHLSYPANHHILPHPQPTSTHPPSIILPGGHTLRLSFLNAMNMSFTQHLVSAAAHHDTWADPFLQQRCILAHAFSKITIWFLEPMNVFLFCRTVEEVVFIPSPFNGFMMCCVSSMWHLASIRAEQNKIDYKELKLNVDIFFFFSFLTRLGKKPPKGITTCHHTLLTAVSASYWTDRFCIQLLE